ncbi:zincin-like metallopeptidase domain-containing protein [Arcicella rosea]|uniref:zincin-like metallopeptidase domain-containing protein n=1 Tax=Arcicella rosea TaxID=502909 RepID=UPI00286DB525|nr:zincin-like metallopeptidase domain-containing protein [Arcicella rosea]
MEACLLVADLGFEPMAEEKHTAYTESCLKVLKDDKRFIFSAASHAQKAVSTFMFAISGKIYFFLREQFRVQRLLVYQITIFFLCRLNN